MPGERRRLEIRVTVALLRVLYTGLALFGILVTPLPALLLAPALGLAAAALVALVVIACEAPLRGRGVLLPVAAVTSGLVPFAEGSRALGTTGDLIAISVLVLSLIVCQDWFDRLERQPAAAGLRPVPSRGAPVGEDDSLRGLLRTLPLDLLLEEWHRVARAVPTQPDRPDGSPPRGGDRSAAQFRELLLAEIASRQPAGGQVPRHGRYARRRRSPGRGGPRALDPPG